jgi:glycine/D-amino acid oxidase-like deaminating enzyme
VLERVPGATSWAAERNGSGRSRTMVGVVGTLLPRLSTVPPAVAEWSIERMWAGLRPISPDLFPLIGFGPDPGPSWPRATTGTA